MKFFILLATNTILWTLTALVVVVDSYNIAIVPKNTKSEDFYGKAFQGCLDYAIPRESTCVYEGTPDASVEGSLDILNRLIDDTTIDAISISVLDTEAYKPVIDRGIALGKPIVTFDSDAPTSDRVAYVGTDNFAMGQELAKLLKQVAPGGGTYGIVSGLGDNLVQRVEGVRSGLTDSLWIEVDNSPKNGEEDIQKSLDRMWDLVNENDGLGAVVSCVGLPMFNENTTNWKEFVDKNPKVLTIIADTLDIQLDLMQQSKVDALVGQLPYTMGYLSAETLISLLDDERVNGTSITENLKSDVIFGTHQLEVLRVPLDLPDLDFDYNLIEKAAIAGYVLASIVAVASIGLIGLTYYYREHKVVKASQPMFLYMICIGTLLMGLAMFPLAIDDEKYIDEESHSDRAADIACMSAPWLISIGFSTSFSALFSKTWRLNKIFLSPNAFKRIKVSEMDVILPFAALLGVNILTLICWTTIAPLRFVRRLEDGTDPWNRFIGSYGQCESTSGAAGDSIPYLVVLAVVNIAALVLANYQAYRARNVRTEFNESSYIAMANASFLQAIVVAVPIIFLTRTNPQAYYIVLSVVLFIVSTAILVFIFGPKVVAIVEAKKNQDQPRRSVLISGLNIPQSSGQLTSGPGNGLIRQDSNGSINSGIGVKFEVMGPYRGSIRSRIMGHRSSSLPVLDERDPVAALIQQYENLSWANKIAVMEKLTPLTHEKDTNNSGSSSTHIESTERSDESDRVADDSWRGNNISRGVLEEADEEEEEEEEQEEGTADQLPVENRLVLGHNDNNDDDNDAEKV